SLVCGSHSMSLPLIPCSDRKRYRALESRRQIERLGQHQAIVGFRRGGVLRRQTHRQAIQPLLRFLPHRAAQLAERDVARWVAAEKIDTPARVRRVPFALRNVGREDDVAVRVVDGEHAFGADDANLEALYGGGSNHRARPRYGRVVQALILDRDHSGGGIDAVAYWPRRLVAR